MVLLGDADAVIMQSNKEKEAENPKKSERGETGGLCDADAEITEPNKEKEAENPKKSEGGETRGPSVMQMIMLKK